jgi:hypothetical protein
MIFMRGYFLQTVGLIDILENTKIRLHSSVSELQSL